MTFTLSPILIYNLFLNLNSPFSKVAELKLKKASFKNMHHDDFSPK